MFFASDNYAGAHHAIASSLVQYAEGFALPCGNSQLDEEVTERLRSIFEHPVSVFLVGTGTAANALALSLLAKPGGITFAYQDAHVITDECNAATFFSKDVRIVPVSGVDGKLGPTELRAQVARTGAAGIHYGRPSAITLAQPTECGTVYSLDELDAIAAVARDNNLPIHMDGARFANALVSLNCTPAEITWKRGINVLSFGSTKNGCWCAEAVILFDTSNCDEFRWIHKRAGQLFSKSRFIAAQLKAYLHDDLWLENARHANQMMQALTKILGDSQFIDLVTRPQANELFVVMKSHIRDKLVEKQVVFGMARSTRGQGSKR